MNSALQPAGYNSNIRNLLGIPDGYYDLELIFPVTRHETLSEDQQFYSESFYHTSNVANIGSKCPSLLFDNGSDATSYDLAVPSRSPRGSKIVPFVQSIETRNSGLQYDKRTEVPHDLLSDLSLLSGLRLNSAETGQDGLAVSIEDVDTIYHAKSSDFLKSDSVTSDNNEDDGSELSDSICDLVLAAFRGEPDLLPDVYAILRRESEAYRATTANTQGTPADQQSKDTIKVQRSSPKRLRATDRDNRSPQDEDPPKAKLRTARNKTRFLAKLKFACAFNKMFPWIFCTHTSIGGTDNFYQSCSGTGWAEIRHLNDHYAEKHGRPQCLNCLEIFDTIQALTTHQRVSHCIRSSERSKEEPINSAVMERILQAYRSATAENPWSKEEIRWYKICFILFPLSLPPKSPYVGQEAETRLLRVVADSLHNRIQANPNSYSSATFRAAIDILQDLNQRLGPALQESELLHGFPALSGNPQDPIASSPVVDESDVLGQPGSFRSFNERDNVTSDLDSNIDPQILLWNSREQIRRMPYQGTGQHMLNEPQNEASMHIDQSEGNSPGPFRGLDKLFEDSEENCDL